MRKFSPVLLFTYNRVVHTRATVEALKACPEASSTDLIVYSDAEKTYEDEVEVLHVRNYLSLIDGFRSVRIVLREKNYGLADNLIGGISDEIQKFGKVIVLEDDMLVSKSFLRFMNFALDHYNEDPNVWHINGWNYPISSFGIESSFFMRLMNCWGWATWENRWKYFTREPGNLIETFTVSDIKKFNMGSFNMFWGQVVANNEGAIETWAIFWYATIFKNKGLCLTPTKSLVRNIGFDGSGTHCGVAEPYKVYEGDLDSLVWPKVVVENKKAVFRIKKMLWLSGFRRRVSSLFKGCRRFL